jgi:SAM-dependent methyltransferase
MDSQINCQPGTLCFSCNICQEICLINGEELRREQASCSKCNSSPRTRAIVRVLSVELFGRNLALPNFPTQKATRGLGMTDWDGYARGLAEKFSYENTYFHQQPHLDIGAKQIASERLESSDFVISSEVLEHVKPPVSAAFANVYRILKPGGLFVLTVPYGPQRETIEHFPELNEFTLMEQNGSHKLRNVTRQGVVQEFSALVFHGGPGSTLEMRVFGEKALLSHLELAGFEEIKIHRTFDFRHGIWWPEPWSLPISARKPGV